MPARAVTVAVNPAVLLVTLDATLITGVTGAATTVTFFVRGARSWWRRCSPLHVRASVPTAPAVYVMVFERAAGDARGAARARDGAAR